jgi:hypothetical protein
MSPTAKKYRVLVGMNWPGADGEDERRAEIGDEVDDLPEGSIEGLLAAGAIEHVKPGRKPKDQGADD